MKCSQTIILRISNYIGFLHHYLFICRIYIAHYSQLNVLYSHLIMFLRGNPSHSHQPYAHLLTTYSFTQTPSHLTDLTRRYTLSIYIFYRYLPADCFHEDIVKYIECHPTLHDFLQLVAAAPTQHAVLELTQHQQQLMAEQQQRRLQHRAAHKTDAIRMHFRCQHCADRASSVLCMPCGHSFCDQCVDRDKCTYCRNNVEKSYTILDTR